MKARFVLERWIP